jgi:hypothetical protein
MLKKTSIILGIVGLIQLIIIACCPEPKTFYHQITDIHFTNCSLSTEIAEGAKVSQKDFRIKLIFEVEILAQLFNRYLLINSLYATSCEDNLVGLKSDIIDFKITCNKEILNTQVGESIDYSKLRIYKIGFTEDSRNQRMTINEFLNILNNGGYLLAFEWYIEFYEAINSDELLRFKIYIKQENGTEFEIETNSIRIE